jgi:GntR family transcriptional regulator of arabinose operon
MIDSTRHRKMYHALREQIVGGRFRVNEKLPSENELTVTFGVSRITVMRALSDLQNDGYIWRKQGVGSFIKSPTEIKCTLGLLIPGIGRNINESIFPSVQSQITKLTSKLGWQVLLGDAEVPSDMDATSSMPVEVARRLVSHGVNAVAFFPFGMTSRGAAYNHNVLSVFTSANVPVVLVGADIVEYPNRSDYDVIALDDQHAGFLLGQHLLAQGCKCVAFVGLANRSPSRSLRLAGLRASLDRAKGTQLVEVNFIKDGRESKDIPAVIKKNSCDAVVAENDETAALTMNYLLNAGLKIPEKIKVCGFDNAPIAELLPVPLTSVAQPAEALANELIRSLRTRIEAPALPGRWIRLHGNLIVRKSTRSKVK